MVTTGLCDDDYVFTTVAAAAVAAALEWSEIAAVLLISQFIWRLYFKSPFDTRLYRLPPRSPFGTFETNRNITTKGIVTFFHRVHERTQCTISTLNLPVPQCRYTCLVVDAKLSRDILTDNTTTKAEGIVRSFEKVTCGTSQFFTRNGPRFYHARKHMAPAFSNVHVSRMNEIVQQKTELWIKNRLQVFAQNGEEIEIAQELTNLTLDIILEAAFEYQMPHHEKEALLYALEVTLREFIFSDPLKNSFWFLFPSVWKAKFQSKEVMKITKNILKAHHKHPHPTRGTVIDCISRNPNYTSDDERAADMINLVVAGHETSASSMAFLLLELAKNPKIQLELQKELRELNEEDRKNSKLLQRCIREAMRLWPVSAPGPFRKTGKEFIVPAHNDVVSGDPRDMIIPNGSAVWMPIICLFRNESIFADHNSFVPSRWETPTDSMKEAWMPFAVGNRNCLGQSLANVEIQTILSHVCANYHFHFVDEGSVDFFLILHPVGIRLKATKI